MLPLEGFRIVAVEQYGAGPFGTLQLADLGAEIVKVENVAEGGDVGRHVRHAEEPLPTGDSMFFQSFNRNKRSITLNLKHPDGQAVLHDLVRTADGVLNNLRGDQPAKLGLTYAQLGKFNRRIVCVHLSAYGREGPRAAWPGYDYLMQAEAGYLALTGEPDGPPTRMGLSLVDLSTGIQAALAMVSGILGARHIGWGRDLDVSLFDAAMANTAYVGAWYLTAGVNQGREPRSSHPSLTPSQLYRTADGWIFIMCNKEKFWPILCRKIDRPDWAADPEFADFAARLRNRARLTEMLDAVLSERPTAAWLEAFAGEVPAAPVNDVAQAMDNPFVRESGRHVFLEHPSGTRVGTVGPAIRCPDDPVPAKPAPAMGADTDAVLTDLGYSEARIAALKRSGAV